MSLTPIHIPSNGWVALLDDKTKKVINFIPVLSGKFYAVEGFKTLYSASKEQLMKDCENAGYKT